MAPKDVSFTISAKDAASAAVKTVENAMRSLMDVVLSWPAAIGAALGAASLGDLFKGAVEAAADMETAINRVATAVGNAGADIAKVQPQIDALIGSLSKSTTFKDSELLAGFEQLVVVTGDVNKSLGSMSLVADIARQRHIDLATAATLVGRVLDGNTSMLKRFGIILNDTRDPMAQLQAKFGGFATNEATTFGGQLERISQGWERFQVSLGQAIIGTEAGRTATNAIVSSLADLEQWVTANQDKIGQLTISVVGAAQAIGGAFVTAIQHAGPLLDWLTGQVTEAVREWSTFIPLIEKYGLIVGTIKYLGTPTGPQSGTPTAFGGTVTTNDQNPWTPQLPPLPNAGQTPAQLAAIQKLNDEFTKLNATTDAAAPKWVTFEAAIAKWQAAAEKAHLPGLDADLQALEATLQELKNDATAKAFSDLWTKTQEQTGNATEKLTAQLGVEIAAFEKQGKAISDPTLQAAYFMLIAHYQQLKEQSISFRATLDQTTSSLSTLTAAIGAHDGNMLALSSDIDAASAIVADWDAKTKDATLSSEDHKAAITELAKAQTVLTDAVKAYGVAVVASYVTPAKDQHELAQQQYQDTVRTAQAYGQLADSVLAAGHSLGVFSQSTTATLQNVVKLAVGIADLFAALGASSSGANGPSASSSSSGSTIGGAAGAGAGIGVTFGPVGAAIGAIVGAIGGIAESITSAQAATGAFNNQNFAAITKLTQTLEETGSEAIALSGNQIQAAQALTAGIAATSGKIIAENLTPAELNLLNDSASAFGIKLNGSAGALQALIAALTDASKSVQLFGSDVASQESLGTLEAHVQGLTGSAAIQATLGAAIAASPALAGLFHSQSVGSFLDAGNGNSVVAGLQALVQQIAGGSITNGMLGGLTPAQFTDTITKLFDAVTALPGVTAPGSIAAAVSTTSTGGLSSSSYSQGDTANSYLLAIRNATVDMRGFMANWFGGGAGGSGGPVTLSIGQLGPIYVDGALASSDVTSGVQSGIGAAMDQALGKLRMNLRAAAGAPRGS